MAKRTTKIAASLAIKGAKESQSSLIAFFESSSDSIILIDKDFKITNFNSSAAHYSIEITGMELAKGRSMLDFSTSATHEDFKSHFNKALAGEITRKEIEIGYPNGKRIWWLVQCIPLKDENDTAIGVAFASANIDIAKRSSERLKSLTDNIPDGAIYEYWMSADRNERTFKYISQTAEKLFELDHSAIVQDGNLIMNQIHKEDINFVQAASLQSTQELTNLDIEFRVKLPSGKMKWIRSKATIQKLEDESFLLEGIFLDVTPQKNAEEDKLAAYRKIEESENNLRAMLNASTDSTVFIDTNGRVRVINDKGIERVRRFYQGEIIGEKFVDFLPSFSKDEYLDFFSRAIGGEIVTFEHEARLPEGVNFMHGLYMPVFDTQNRLIGVSQSVTDVTDRKLAELALKQSEERFKLLYNKTPSMMDSISEKGELLSVNDYWLEKMGYTREEVIGKDASIFLTQESKQLAEKSIVRIFFETGRIDNVEYHYITKSGKILIGLLSANAERDENGKIIKSLSVINDITEKKALEAELEKLALIAQKTTSLVIITNPEQQIEWVNKSFETVTGYTLGEVIGKKPSSFLQGTDTDTSINAKIKQNLINHLPSRFEIVNYTKSGQKYWLDIEIQPVFDSSGTLKNYIAIESDITQRKLAQEELRNSQIRLQAIFDNAMNAIILADNEGNYVDGNMTACKMLGYSREELITLNVRHITVPSSVTVDPFNEFLKNEHQAGTIELKTKQEKIITARYNAVSNILPGLHLSILEDITEKRKSQMLIKKQDQDIRTKNEQFLSIAENIPFSAVYQLSIRNNGFRQFLFMSNGITEFTGLSNGAILKDAELFYRAIHKEDKELFKRAKENSILTISTFDIEFRRFHTDGTIRWLHVRSMPKAVQEGVLFDGYISDVTERKTLTENLYLTRFTIDHAHECIFWIVEDASFFDFNTAAYESLGYSREEFKSLRVSDIDINYDKEVWPEHWQLFKEVKTMTFESSQRRKDGSIKDVEITANLINYQGVDYNCSFVKDITERNQHARKIKETQELLNTIAGNLPNGAVYQFLMSADGHFSFPYISEGIENVLGKTSQEIMQNSAPFLSSAHPEDVSSFRQAVSQSATHLKEFHHSARFLDTANKYHWLSAHSKPRRLSNGSILWDGLLIDDTKEKEAEEVMKFTNFTLDHISDIILWINEDASIINANPAATLELGFSKHELQNMSIPDFDLLYTKEVWAYHWVDIVQKRSITFESQYICKDKSVFPVEINASIIEYKGKEYICAIVRNISERKRTETERDEREKALTDSEERFRNLIRDLQVGVLLQDSTSQVLMNNHAAINLLGVSEDQLLGRTSFDPAWNVIHDNGKDFPSSAHPVPMAIKTQKAVENVIMGVYRPLSKDRIWLQVNAHPIFNQAGELIHVICSFLDISKVREYQETLKKNLHEKEVLVKEIHHRVKNNLQLISSLIYIRMTRMENSEVKSFLEETRQKIHSIALIHETLLQKESVNEINISDFMEKLLINLQSSYSTNEKSIRVNHSIEPIIMKLDTAINCSLILNELFINSIKHAFKETQEATIDVAIRAVGKNVEYIVSDNGSASDERLEAIPKQTFGIQMLDVFFKQINATVSIDKTKGTSYKIIFPL